MEKRCARCGLLASRNWVTRTLDETEQSIRDTGEIDHVFDDTSTMFHEIGSGHPRYERPLCLVGARNLWAEFGKECKLVDIVVALNSERKYCGWFTEYQQGFTPKEHKEMLDRQELRDWQEKQRNEDKHWRMIELVVFGVISVLVAGGFTILGAFIGRGGP